MSPTCSSQSMKIRSCVVRSPAGTSRMRLKQSLLVLSLTAFAGSFAPATAQSKKLPRVRSLGTPEATIILGMNGQPSVRILSTGQALAADFFNRRLAMVDSGMKSIETVFDAMTPAPLTYPPGFAQLVSGFADTTLFFDANARGYRVIDPTGRVVRRISLLDPSLLRGVQSPLSGSGLDPNGRLVLATHRTNFDKPVSGVQPQAESLMIARVTLDRVGWDSLGAIMGSGQKIVQTGDTSMKPRPVVLTMPVVDRGD